MVVDSIRYSGKNYQVSTVYIENMKTYETMIFPIEDGIVSGKEVYLFRTTNTGESIKKHANIIKIPEKYVSKEAISTYLKAKNELSEPYNLRICDCGSEDNPMLYGEGMAKQYIEDAYLNYPNMTIKHSKKSNIYFSGFDGYVVECSRCGAITKHYSTPEAAVENWNNKIIEYCGDSDEYLEE